MAWRESRGIWTINCCILAKRSSMFAPFIGDNSGKKIFQLSLVLSDPVLFITLLCCWGQYNCTSPAPLCHSSVQTSGCTHTSLTSPVAASPVTEANPGVSWAYEGLRSHCKTTHTGTAPLQQVQDAATSQLCHGPRAGQSCSTASHHCHPAAQPAKTTAVLECWE